MFLRLFGLSAALALLLGDGAWAQQQVTVQLPTFRFFGVSTTVSVPDRGGAHLGGISRASSGSVSRGVPGLGRVPGAGPLFNNRGIGSATGASNMSVTARIIDHQEMDQAVLAAAAAQREAQGGALSAEQAATQRRAAFLSRHIARSEPVESVANASPSPQARSIPTPQRAVDVRQEREKEMRQYLAQGQQAEAAGKLGVAKIFYQMAQRRASEPLQSRIAAHLETLNQNRAARIATRER